MSADEGGKSAATRMEQSLQPSLKVGYTREYLRLSNSYHLLKTSIKPDCLIALNTGSHNLSVQSNISTLCLMDPIS